MLIQGSGRLIKKVGTFSYRNIFFHDLLHFKIVNENNHNFTLMLVGVGPLAP